MEHIKMKKYKQPSAQRGLNNFFKRIPMSTDNTWGIPIIQKQCMEIPTQLTGFNFCLKKSPTKNDFVHFFLDDYQFERVWNYPQKYIERFKKHGGVLSPDFSMYLDMPLALQIFSVYKNRWIGAYMQNCGIKVIPTISWGTSESYDFSFQGVEVGSIVAISTVGVLNNSYSKKVFVEGYNEMIKRLKPEKILIYGKSIPEAQGIYYKSYMEITNAKIKKERDTVWVDEVHLAELNR